MILADHKLLRQINRANILKIILDNGLIPRTELSKLSGLNQSTISRIVKDLIKEQLVYEENQTEIYNKVGRKPVNLKLNPRAQIFGIIDVTLSKTTLSICDLYGNVLERQEVISLVGEAEKFFSSCANTIRSMASLHSEHLYGVGVSVPGVVRYSEGYLYLVRKLKWKNVDIRGIVSREVGCKVFVENDARAGALAELWFSEKTRNLNNFVFVLVCNGVGTGIVMNRTLYRGTHSMSGQFHADMIKIDDKWEDLSGEYTWENNSSDLGIVVRYSDYTGENRGGDVEEETQRIINLARQGDYSAIRALQETARFLGVGIARINNSLDPERIIIGGKIVQVWDIIFPELIKQVEKQTPYQVVPVRDLIIPSSFIWAPFDGIRAMLLHNLFGVSIIIHYES